MLAFTRSAAPQESPLLEEWLSAQRHDLGLTESHHAPAGTRIEQVFCADEVGAAKPDPALYLAASQAFGVAPQHCLVVEDRSEMLADPIEVAEAEEEGVQIHNHVAPKRIVEQNGRAVGARQEAERSGSAKRDRSWRIALVWIWHTRLSVTLSTSPISASVRPS